MRFLRRVRRALSRRDDLATIGEVDDPRAVDVTGEIVAPRELVSPVSGRACAYYHIEIGETVELPFPRLRDERDRRAFRALAELRSSVDLVVATLDRRRIVVPSGFFLVRASVTAMRSSPLSKVPEELVATLSALPSTTRALGYREIALHAGDRVRFAGVVEAVLGDPRDGYRDAPKRTLRMRPEREPIVVETVT